MMQRKNKKYKAFTLVELIIVITILAILATISFVTFSHYFKESRDASRVTTLANIKKGLDIFYTEVGNYPKPENISSTGSIYNVHITNVGVIGPDITKLLRINGFPIDPLTNNEYVYGVDTKGLHYQIASIQETPFAYIPNIIFEQTYANSLHRAKVDGRYSGYIQFSTGGNKYIANLPSLLHSNTGSVSLLSTGTYYIVDKMQNLPYSQEKNFVLGQISSDKIIQDIHHPTAILTGVNITNINGENIENIFSGNILQSFGGDIIKLKKDILGINSSISNIIPAQCNIGEDGSTGICKDPYWSNVSLLLHGENFIDSTGKNILNSIGDIRIDTIRKKFGDGSFYFDGSGDALQIDDNNHFDFGTGAFTIDAWVNTDLRGGYDRIIAGGTNSDGPFNQWLLGAWPSTRLNFGYQNGGYIETAPTLSSWNNNQWYHVSISRSGANIYLFWNGDLVSTWNIGINTPLNTGSYGITLGARYHNQSLIEFFHGNIDEIRITKGIARYTSSFVIPTQSYTHE